MNTSNRQKKKIAQQGADALRQKPGWDPSSFQRSSAKDQLRELGSKEKSEGAYQSSSTCAECVKTRTSLGDDTALCQKHLAEAMGM
jgi:hypothetical protein